MGKGLAILLSKKQANVIIVARNQQKLDEALVEIKVSAIRHAANEIRSSLSCTYTAISRHALVLVSWIVRVKSVRKN